MAFCAWDALQTFYLENSKISGTLSESFAKWSGLEYFTIRCNLS